MAATGNAYDGLFFILLVAGFLLMIYLLLTVIEFISRNGRRICMYMGHKIHILLLFLFRHRKVNHFDPVCLGKFSIFDDQFSIFNFWKFD